MPENSNAPASATQDMAAQCSDTYNRPELRCPTCGGTVESTGSGPSCLSSDQWDAAKAGDYYCTGSCVNPGRENRLVYFWAREVVAASSCDANASEGGGS